MSRLRRRLSRPVLPGEVAPGRSRRFAATAAADAGNVRSGCSRQLINHSASRVLIACGQAAWYVIEPGGFACEGLHYSLDDPATLPKIGSSMRGAILLVAGHAMIVVTDRDLPRSDDGATLFHVHLLE